MKSINYEDWIKTKQLMNNHRDILLKILDTIEYQDDRELFVSEFEKNIQLQAIADLINSLPVESQETIKQKLSNPSNSPETVSTILKRQFSETQILMALENVARDSFTKYIQTINNTLSEVQRNNLIKVLKDLSQNSASVTP